ncbi:hypothetical protein [Fodinicurvata sp. EGI_FJ10296]|uniref:hypothetical protein n=1 Tax=Fodinicurvata sp. EGI_FJ10296 TaxID=3231908 RepID=UPI0034569405
MTGYRESRNRRRKLREIAGSLSRIDSNYFVQDLIRLAKQDPEYGELVDSLKLSEDKILSYYTLITINFPDNDLLWIDGEYLPACIIFYRPTLFHVHTALQAGETIDSIVRSCHRYLAAGRRGAVRNFT